ncbi:MAG: MBL fold metallo-hydrolase, partial [Chitinophagaceae bacterium]
LVAGGGYRVLFVNFRDYIWVMEAPAGEASREVIKKIKETLPGKPIKYIAVTHFHSDHSSGIRSYVVEGATVVTTKGNRNHFEELAKNSFTISPDALSMNPQLPKMEFVENKKRVFTDGITTIELYDIGPSPHADELLVAYLPKEKILVEADVFDFPFDGRTASNIHFGKWIEEKGLDVEKIIPVHGTITTMENFRAALTALEQRKK